MESSYSRHLRIWEAPPAVSVQPLILTSPPSHLPRQALLSRDIADRLYASEILSSSISRASSFPDAEPYSLQWFLNIEGQRHGRQGKWIPRLLEFAKHSGENLLGLGNGLGTDWLQYARHGASVVVCSPSAEQLSLVRRNFELRGLTGRFVHASATSIPLDAASIDVVCMSGLLQEVDDPQAVVAEVYRVLKPGGKVLAVAPARYDVDFWSDWWFPYRHWFQRQQMPQRLARRFSRRELRRLFRQFVEHRIHKRHLRRADLPHVWRWAPMHLMERLMGRILVLKAFKPLSVAISSQAAA